ncbi:protease inhibitor I42 family protein [Actinokineospora auranticolor]|uniref:Putative secreted protein n=1 Tax=Actinokineospora auranticolor TaxID=155976 RepID=A0A2S6GZH4_9PSEU|nr:protease inhibitor I42 family protein [Actinokineospora auranticolor]PPK70566.1 putative secreted protein [Actinokineospora auranticolor]
MALVHLGVGDADGPTELHRGDTVELRLPESTATGYRWRWWLPEALRLIADEHVPAAVGAGAPGAAGVRRLAFDVTTTGLHELRAELAEPWEPLPRQALTFVLHAV